MAWLPVGKIIRRFEKEFTNIVMVIFIKMISRQC